MWPFNSTAAWTKPKRRGRGSSPGPAGVFCGLIWPTRPRSGALIARGDGATRTVGVLVNNASRFDRDEWHDVTRASWDAHMDANLRTPFVLTQAFARLLPPDAEGVVINMIDQRVWSLTPHFVSYTVSKAGLWALTQTMALALAPRIRVNAIGPGPALPSPRQTEAPVRPAIGVGAAGSWHRPGRGGAAAVMILALPAMTGQMIALDGGQHLQWAPCRTSRAPRNDVVRRRHAAGARHPSCVRAGHGADRQYRHLSARALRPATRSHQRRSRGR